METAREILICCSETGADNYSFRRAPVLSGKTARYCSSKQKYCFTSCDFCKNSCPCPHATEGNER